VGLTDPVVRSMPELLAAIETDILTLQEHQHVAALQERPFNK
jgi:hypothetical protein